MNIERQVALITGDGRWSGRAIAQELTKVEMHVVVVARR